MTDPYTTTRRHALTRQLAHGEALTRVVREARKVVRALPPSCPVGLVSLLQAVEGLEAVENALAGLADGKDGEKSGDRPDGGAP